MENKKNRYKKIYVDKVIKIAAYENLGRKEVKICARYKRRTFNKN